MARGKSREIGPVFRKALGMFESQAEFGRQVGVKDRRNIREWLRLGYIPMRWAMAVVRATGGRVTAVEIINETTRILERNAARREALAEIEAKRMEAIESTPQEGPLA